MQEQAINVDLLPLNQQAPKSAGPIGRLAGIINGIARKALNGAIQAKKRSGFSVLPTTTLENGSPVAGGTNAHLLTPYRERLVKVCKTTTTVFSEAKNAWEEPLGVFSTPPVVAMPTISRAPLYNGNSVVYAPDGASIGDVFCRVFTDSVLGTLVTFVDTNGVQIRAPLALTGTATAKVTADGAQFWVFSQSTAATNTFVQVFDTGGAQLATATLAWGSARKFWDVGYQAANAKVFNLTSTGATTTFTYLSYAGGVISSSATTQALDSTTGLARLENTQGGTLVHFVASNASFDVARYTIDATGTVLVTFAIASAVGFVGSMTGYLVNGSFDAIVAVANLADSTGTNFGKAINNQVLVYSSPHTGAASLTVTQRSLCIASRAFEDSDGMWRIVAFYSSFVCFAVSGSVDESLLNAQPSFFVMDLSVTLPVVSGQFQYGDAYAIYASNRNSNVFTPNFIPSVASDLAGVMRVPLGYQAEQTANIVNVGGTDIPFVSSTTGLYDFAVEPLSNPARSVSTTDALLIGGLQATAFDGVQFVESGFHLAPEMVSAVASTTGGHLTHNETYTWVFLYEWIDGDGQIYQSQLSTPVQIPIGTNDKVTFTIATLRTTAKPRVRISVYRTFDPLGGTTAGTILRKVGEGVSSVLSDTISIVDGASDATAAIGQSCYTQPLIPQAPVALEYFPPPAFSKGCTFDGRAFLVGYDNAIWFSFQKSENIGQAFNPFFRIVLPTSAQIVSIAPLDARLAIVCDDGTAWTMAGGNLPNADATEGAIPQPEQLPFTTGTTGPMLVIPEGAVYVAERGAYLMDRSLDSKYIGAPVDDEFTSVNTVVSIDADQNQRVYFAQFPTQVLVVYDIVIGIWYTWTVPQAIIAACSWKGRYAFIDSQEPATVWVLDPDENRRCNDNGAEIISQYELASIDFSGVNGYESVWQVQFYGQYAGPHQLTIDLKYDQSDAVTETFHESITTDPGIYRFEVMPKQIDCQAIAMTFTDGFIGLTPGDSFTLESIGFLVGVERGLGRIPPTTRRIAP